MKTGAELRNAKLRVGKMKAEVGKMEAEVRVRDERVGKMEAEVRVREERVGKMEAEVRVQEAEVRVRDERVGKMEARLELAKAALASSNTELLRYKRKCVPVDVWMGRPTHGLAPCLTSLTSPTRSCVYTYLPFTDQLTIRSVIELVERSLSPKKARLPSLSREDTWLEIFELNPELEAQVRAICGAKDTTGAVRAFQDLYKKLSHEIHNPDAVTVPIPLGRLSFVTAALVVLLCRRLPIHYHILSADNVDLGGGYTPEQVKRGEFQEGGG